MKRMLCVWMVLCLLGTQAFATALRSDSYTDVPSVMTHDSVLSFTAGAAGEVAVLPPDAGTSALLEDLYAFVWSQKNRPARFYDTKTQHKIERLVPEITIDALHMSEFMGVQLPDADPAAETAFRLEVEGDYAPGQLIVAVLGVPAAAAWQWYPYRCEAVSTGVICWEVPAVDYRSLAADRAVLHVLTIRQGVGDAQSGIESREENTPRPSKQADDLSRVETWESASGTALADDFRIFFVDKTDPMREEISRIAERIGEGVPPVRCFPETIRQEAQQLLPHADVDALAVYDIVAVQAENYRDTYGDVSTTNRFAASYRADKAMMAVLGFWSDETGFAWYVLRASALSDADEVEIVYKQLVLPMMEEKAAMLVVFSESLTEKEVK